MHALSLARGWRDTARLSNIIVIRKDAEGKAMSTNIDLEKSSGWIRFEPGYTAYAL